jgi:hypothetical protein
MKPMTWTIGTVMLISAAVAAAGYVAFAGRQASLKIGDRELTVETVRSPWDLYRGLSGREDLPDDSGMLFVLPYRGIHPFWMKDMKFAIDIVWLDGGQVVEVATLSAPTSTAYVPRHDPIHQADRVLEVKAGMAQELGLKQGFRLVLPD